MSEGTDEKETALARAVEALTPAEAHALRYFKQARQPEVSPDKSAEMFELYLNGKSCDEIRRLNKGLSLGQIIHCRVRDEWDLKRDQHRASLQVEVVPRVMDAQLEAADFLGDMLAASVRLHGDAIKMFLQTGDKGHLKGTPLESGFTLKQIRDLIDTLRAVTGQGDKKVVEHRGSVSVDHTPRVSQDEAADILDALVLDPVKR